MPEKLLRLVISNSPLYYSLASEGSNKQLLNFNEGHFEMFYSNILLITAYIEKSSLIYKFQQFIGDMNNILSSILISVIKSLTVILAINNVHSSRKCCFS